MSKKQWIWLCVAIVLFAGCGALSVAMNTWSANSLGLSAGADAWTSGEGEWIAEEAGWAGEYVARINIEGIIMASGDAASYASGEYFDLDYTLDYIDRLIYDEANAGILLYINSSGGTMGASDEVYLKLMDYKKQTGRPIYAYFGDTACSGAYYIAMAADEIWANRNSICVNIGVYISSYNFSGLFEQYGVEQVVIRSSENKGIGLAGVPWTEEQREIYQSIVDLYYEQFLEVVAEGRDMTCQQVRELDDGREMLAAQALEAGFIDGIGRYEEYEAKVLSRFDDGAWIYEEYYEQAPLAMLLEYFYSKAEALTPVSEEKLLQGLLESRDGIVVMAYAG